MEGILEGLLYVTGDDGLTIKQIMDVLNLTEEETKKLIYNLKQEYEKDNHGIRIKYFGDLIKLTTKEEHKEYYEKLITNETTNTLSQAALEVLAIIAYNEPITRGQIDEMRGVESVYVLRKLLAKGLIKEAGRSENPGHPILYKITNDFLDYFGLESKDELPEIKEIEKDEEEKDLYKSNYKEE